MATTSNEQGKLTTKSKNALAKAQKLQEEIYIALSTAEKNLPNGYQKVALAKAYNSLANAITYLTTAAE